MIHELYANKSSFKKIQFNKGINIILAEGDDNTENSRNGLGKTTLVHIIHFCLGGTPNKKYLPEDTFNDWEFTISIDISNEKIYAKRSFNEKSIIIVEGNFSKFPLKPTYSEEKEIYFYTLNEWKEVLGTSLLGLKNEKEFRFKPTFRKVISYFIRRDEDIKKSPFKTSSTHKNIDVIDCTSFCVGLDWKLMSKYKEYGDEIKRLNENFSNLKSIHGSKGQLVPEMNRLKKDLTKIKEDLDNYKVHESYRQIEKSADILSKEIQELVEKTIFLNKKIDIYEESIKEENIDDINVEEIYNEINFYFPENVKKTLRESKEFHKNIIFNRTNFLKTEIQSIKNDLSLINQEIEIKSDKKAGYMDILNNFGALNEYNNMQKYYTEQKSEYELIVNIIKQFDEITNKKNKLKVKLLELESRFQINYDENINHLNSLIDIFSDNSSYLYDVPGDLIIECSEKGFEYNVDIPRINSTGKTKMIVLCYDLMLLENFVGYNYIDFLIHDSNIFDGVDSRQYASALNLIYEKTTKFDMQYICMLNSDSIPDNLNFNIEDHVVLELNDNSIEGTLLGFEF
ncbi:DUF2326 domain-containing protein [Methanobrevibacter smithii]|jgi:uncharacterized protein YydD (DUF2326 family)|uniref:DUF2326 domain-containing protein n=1 Tax=Methanobrevibacter smithii TaxID=2173 RepID=UPI0020473D6F|nr:MAG TPA: putative ATPase [Caudoviricetes sp.]